MVHTPRQLRMEDTTTITRTPPHRWRTVTTTRTAAEAMATDRLLVRGAPPPLTGPQALPYAQAAEILQGRAPKGAVHAEHWTRKAMLKK